MDTLRSRSARGLTVIELLVVVAVSAVLIAIAVPSLSSLIATQRLRSINAELMTDIQFARSTAVSRHTSNVHVQFQQTSAMSCYVVFMGTFLGACDCTLPAGSICSGTFEEIKTAQVSSSTDVQVVGVTGGLLNFTADGMAFPSYQISTSRISGAPGQFLISIGATGRPSACYSANPGTPSC